MTFVAACLLSKLFFFVEFITWGSLPEPFYDFLLYATHWPSLLAGTCQWFYERNGVQVIDMGLGLFDSISMFVNSVGQLPIGLAVGYAYKKLHVDARA